MPSALFWVKVLWFLVVSIPPVSLAVGPNSALLLLNSVSSRIFYTLVFKFLLPPVEVV